MSNYGLWSYKESKKKGQREWREGGTKEEENKKMKGRPRIGTPTLPYPTCGNINWLKFPGRKYMHQNLCFYSEELGMPLQPYP